MKKFRQYLEERNGGRHVVMAHSRARGISSPVKSLDGEIEFFDNEKEAKKEVEKLNSENSSPHVYYTYGGEL